MLGRVLQMRRKNTCERHAVLVHLLVDVFFGKAVLFRQVFDYGRGDALHLAILASHVLRATVLVTVQVRRQHVGGHELRQVERGRARLRKQGGGCQVSSLVLQDHPMYRQLYAESLRDDPLIPLIVFVPLS